MFLCVIVCELSQQFPHIGFSNSSSDRFALLFSVCLYKNKVFSLHTNTMIANYKSSRPVYNWSFSVKLQIKASGEKGVWRVIMAPINPVYWEESRWKRHSVTEERAEDNEEQTTLTILVKELNRERPLLQHSLSIEITKQFLKNSHNISKKCLEIRNKKILYLFIYFLYELQSHEALWMM